MEQPTGSIEFREVDQEGHPVDNGLQTAAVGGQPGRTSITAVNPFIVVLWVVAVALVGGGGITFLNANLAAGPMSGAMPMSFLLLTFAPYAIFIGLVAVIGLLFWHANQWQRRHSQDS
jgi:hypothetical protein